MGSLPANNHSLPKPMAKQPTFDELHLIYNEARKIFDSNLSWEAKFDLIFSENVSRKVELDWAMDADYSCEDDVTAFMDEFDRYMGVVAGVYDPA
jgi:hypothetical protein